MMYNMHDCCTFCTIIIIVNFIYLYQIMIVFLPALVTCTHHHIMNNLEIKKNSMIKSSSLSCCGPFIPSCVMCIIAKIY